MVKEGTEQHRMYSLGLQHMGMEKKMENEMETGII